MIPSPPLPGPRRSDANALARLRALGFRSPPDRGEPTEEGGAPPGYRAPPFLDLRGALVVLVVAVLGLALAAFVFLRARPHALDLGSAPVAPGAPHPTGESPRAARAEPVGGAPRATPPSPRPDLVVDVEGKVAHPGVVTVPPGSRVRDALAAAGGPLPGVPTTTLNLAEPLSDGEQVVLGMPGTTGATSSLTGARARPGQLLDLNSASEADLTGLPGVGPVIAGRILEFRRLHGRFTSVEELREVAGIGPAKFAGIRGRVRV